VDKACGGTGVERNFIKVVMHTFFSREKKYIIHTVLEAATVSRASDSSHPATP